MLPMSGSSTEDGHGRRPDTERTRTARDRYDRIADVYDVFEGLMEGLAYRRWRALAWKMVEGERILEIGVGTGKNLPFQPRDREVVAVDLSPRMLRHAVRRGRGRPGLRFARMDAQALGFPDVTFDAVVATFVFCSVPDPIRGLRQALRVLRPGGRLVLLEHVLSSIPVLRQAMRLVNPICVALTGANIDRDTVANVGRSGFELEEVRDLGVSGIYKLIRARRPPDP